MHWRSSIFRNRNTNDKRVKALAFFFIIVAVIMIGRLFDLQIIKGGFYSALASGQHDLYKKLFPQRGSIYVLENNGGKKVLYPLVTNQKLSTLYAVPVNIKNPTSTAEKLFEVLGFPENVDPKEAKYSSSSLSNLDPELAKEIQSNREQKWNEEQKQNEIDRLILILSKPNRLYESIRQKLTDKQVEAIKVLNLEGINFKEETWRFYPEQGMGGHVFGFWGFEGDDRQGKYGLEGFYDTLLSGEVGEIHTQRDALGNMITVGDNSITEKSDGADLVLTIDRSIQYKACRELFLMVEKSKAKGGSIIVMEPKTGAILAMCSFPDYDPAKYNEIESIQTYNNPAIFNAFEPGSVFKTITMAAALDAGKVRPDTTYVDTGVVDYGKYKIRNYNDKVYGRQTMTNVLEASINTGVIFAMRATTPKVFAQYVRNFGFGDYTGIELDKEMPGNVSNLNLKGEVNIATITFGQGITVTPLQMVTAVGALINGGKLMKPYVVSQIIKSDKKIENIEPKVVRQVISPKTSSLISAMMVSVAEGGHANSARIPGYRVGGKTGTAQVPQKGGGYQPDSVINGSFVGFAPYADPKFVIFVDILEPQYGKVGETVAAPVFSAVGKFILQYYNVPYDNPSDPALKKG
ncbi:MAG: penicillin-binding protein 2 [Candidatus Buchananbacteria bacterium]